MSILIKGMKMPKSCAECRFFVDAWCYAFKADDWRNAYNKPTKGERLDNCPLVELPPHGRLIDADALFRTMNEVAWYSNADRDEVALEIVLDAKTIIPAEGGADG